MISRRCAPHVIALLFAFAATAAGDNALKPQVGDAELPKPGIKQPVQAREADAARKQCVMRCETANGLCNSEVRQSRQECSKQAATAGNDPFTGRSDTQDSFCGYFNRDHCGFAGNRGTCSQRFAQRYAECAEWMRGNIASRRFDCVRAETKAQGLCRAELQDCRTTCE
jgi:hypothetical protein